MNYEIYENFKKVKNIKRNELLGADWVCECGARHVVPVKIVSIRSGAINDLPSAVKDLTGAKKILLISDSITHEVAGKQAANLLAGANVGVRELVLPFEKPVVDSETAAWVTSQAGDEDLLVSCGSGTVTDLTKYTAFKKKRPFISVATAASMNGYASGIVAITEKGVKKTVPANPPAAVIADLDILRNAPSHMTCAGLGDVISKPVSMADWKLASFVKGETFCPVPFEIIKDLEKIYMGSPKLLAKGDEKTIAALTEALVFSGISMVIAGSSAPASGGEHLISHTLDMQAALKNKRHDLHGAQVGVAAVVTASLYERVLKIDPGGIDLTKIREHHEADKTSRFNDFWGAAAPFVCEEYRKKQMPWTEKKEELTRIFRNWDAMVSELSSFLIPSVRIKRVLTDAGAKSHYIDIGVSPEEFRQALVMAKTMRSRYTILDLADDLNVLEPFAGELK
jgi:glycerol-1-phosphate dehydrogenase [NAD(P)+]